MQLWNYIKKQLLSFPAQTIGENDAELTFEEILIFAEKFAKQLSGVKCCGIICQSELAAAIALLCCFAADVTALPLSYRYGELHCNKILDTISPDAVITDQDGVIQLLRITDSGYTAPLVRPALIMCTSGTTGIPKGAMLTEENVYTNLRDIMSYFKIDGSDTILIARPLYHCAVLTGEFLTAICKGTRIRFYSGSFNPALMLNLLEEHRITAFCGTPTLLGMLARFSRNGHQYNLRHICISGECMGRETGKRIAKAFPYAAIYHIYGLTEACPRVSYLPPNLFDTYPDYVGVPLESVSLKVIAADGRTADPNEVGILWVKGGNVMVGYYNDPKKTAEVIKDEWLCTGDLAFINEAGLLKIKGRNDDLIIKAGMNIYPQEIVNTVKQDPRVYDVYVYGQEDENRGVQIVMNIVGNFSTTEEVRVLCRECLPSYQMPAKINLLDELPRNGSGKIVKE